MKTSTEKLTKITCKCLFHLFVSAHVQILLSVGDSWWWGSLTMVPAVNKAKCLSSVNHTTKTIYHYHHYHRCEKYLHRGHWEAGFNFPVFTWGPCIWWASRANASDCPSQALTARKWKILTVPVLSQKVLRSMKSTFLILPLWSAAPFYFSILNPKCIIYRLNEW